MRYPMRSFPSREDAPGRFTTRYAQRYPSVSSLLTTFAIGGGRAEDKEGSRSSAWGGGSGEWSRGGQDEGEASRRDERHRSGGE